MRRASLTTIDKFFYCRWCVCPSGCLSVCPVLSRGITADCPGPSGRASARWLLNVSRINTVSMGRHCDDGRRPAKLLENTSIRRRSKLMRTTGGLCIKPTSCGHERTMYPTFSRRLRNVVGRFKPKFHYADFSATSATNP